jgi:hypothetical protein
MSDRAVRIASRVLWAIVAGMAMWAIALSREISRLGDGRDSDATQDHVVFGMYIAALVLGGLPAAMRATMPTLRVWAIFAWTGAVVYYGGIAPDNLDRTFDVVMKLMSMLALAGSLLLATVAFAAARPRIEGAPRRSERLRSLMRLMMGIGVVIATVGFFPGRYVVDTAHLTIHATRTPGGVWLVLLLAVLLAPAIVVHADPARRGTRLLWVGWCYIGANAFFAAAAYLGRPTQHEYSEVILWPNLVAQLGLGVLGVLIGIALPAILITTREAKIPAARVIDSSRRATDS